jgi:hypothetical protein
MAPAIKTRCEARTRDQSRPVFALATRPALALFAAHSALRRCLRVPAQLQGQRLRVSKGPAHSSSAAPPQ